MAQIGDQWLEQMPEIGILRGIAAAAEKPIRIRGGVPRNLLARAFAQESVNGPAPTHLVDLVDPLSDIDIVVSGVDESAFVLGLIFQRLSLAGFTRWEVKSEEQVAHFERVGAMSSFDGVEIEITKQGARLSRADEAIRDLEERRVRGRFPAERAHAPIDIADVDAILFALRIERFASQFALDVDEQVSAQIPPATRKAGRISPADVLRIELAALDILLTAPTRTAVDRGLQRVREIVPGWMRRHSRVLTELEDVPLDRPLRVIAFPRLGAQPPRVRLETDVRSNTTLNDEPTLLPWTAIRLPRFGQGACCPPDDFTLGPLVIAWRGQHLQDTRAGVIALAPPADPYETPSRLVFGVPGIVTTTPTVVQRLDWGFARYLAGDGRLVYIGARSAMTPPQETR